MDSTAKTSFKAKGKKWSDIVAHVDRLHKSGHYKNTNIDLSKADYNFCGYIHNPKKDNYKYFMPFILLQNIRKESTGHNNKKDNEIYSSVRDYFNKRGYSNQRNSMFEIGNKDYRKKYYRILNQKGLNNKQIRLIEARSLVDDVKEYNANSCQSVGAYSVNCDECTAHIHFQNLSYPPKDKLAKIHGTKRMNIMPRGKKWKRKLKRLLLRSGISKHEVNYLMSKRKLYVSKPSASFNTTWQLEFPNAKNKKGQFDSRKAIHMARNKYDRMVIKNFNKELAKAGVKDFKLHLVRTHNINHKEYNQWLSSQVANDKTRKANHHLMITNAWLNKNENSLLKSVRNHAVSEAVPSINATVASSESSVNNAISISASTSISSTVSSINSSNKAWQSSLNASFISASVSASNSIKAKDKALASESSSLSMASDSFDSSVYGGYASQLSNVMTPYVHQSTSSNYWLNIAKGSRIMSNKDTHKIISNPISYMANWQSSRASSASSSYDSLQKENKALNSKNRRLSDTNNNLSRQITGKRSTLSKLDDKIKRAKDKIKGIYSGAVFNLLNDVIPSNDRRFSGLKRRGMGSLGYKTNKGFDATKLMGVANGNASISINHRHYHGLGAVLHIIGYDVKHTINKAGTDKAKEDSKAKAKQYDERAKAQRETSESAEISQIQARANDNGPTWGE